jgi:hypothetical protein
VGFTHEHEAFKVQKHINKSSELLLKSTICYYPSTSSPSSSLEEDNDYEVIPTLIINHNSSIKNDNYTLDKRILEDVELFSTINNIGFAIAYKNIEDDDNRYIYYTRLIEPGETSVV